MSIFVGGFGSLIQLRASTTFPNGVNLTQFADDTDPFDVPSLQIADKAMGTNGDLILWPKANPIPITFALIPNGIDDRNVSILFEANRVSKGKFPALDLITMVWILPDGSKFTFDNGGITDGMPANAVSSAQRLKSKPYSFAFQSVNSVSA